MQCGAVGEMLRPFCQSIQHVSSASIPFLGYSASCCKATVDGIWGKSGYRSPVHSFVFVFAVGRNGGLKMTKNSLDANARSKMRASHRVLEPPPLKLKLPELGHWDSCVFWVHPIPRLHPSAVGITISIVGSSDSSLDTFIRAIPLSGHSSQAFRARHGSDLASEDFSQGINASANNASCHSSTSQWFFFLILWMRRLKFDGGYI